MSKRRMASESIAAYRNSVEPTLDKRYLSVMRVIVSNYQRGLRSTTSEDVSQTLGQAKNYFSGRMTELRKMGLIKREDRAGWIDRRDGCGCHIPTKKGLDAFDEA